MDTLPRLPSTPTQAPEALFESSEAYHLTPSLVLLEACKSGELPVVELMLQIQSPNLRDSYGATPLMWAAASGHTQIVDRLLEHPELDIDAQDHQGCSALMRSVQAGHADIALRLLIEPCNPDLVDHQGCSALMQSIALNDCLLPTLLLPFSNPNLHDHAGRSARDHAQAANLPLLVSILDAFTGSQQAQNSAQALRDSTRNGTAKTFLLPKTPPS